MTKTAQGTTLDTIIIFTEHMAELAEFYAAVLEIGPFQAQPGHLGCQLEQVYFGFDQVDQVEGERPGGVTTWFRVIDLQKTFDKALSLGAKVRYPPTQKPWGDILACIYDPDGNMLGLAQR